MRIKFPLIISAFIFLAVVLGFYISPSRKEVALMRLEDRNFNEAFKYYKAKNLKGDNSINILAPLIKIYIYYGMPEMAISLLEKYVEENPNSIEGRKQLTELYKSTQKFFQYCESLEKLQKLSSSAHNLRNLADTYSFLGMYPQERRALALLVKGGKYHLLEEDYVRLASLYLAEQKQSEAMEVLSDLFSKNIYNVSISTIHMAVQLFSKNDKEKEALGFAKSYLKHLKEEEREDSAIVLSGVLQREGKLDYAYRILEPYLANIDNSPDLLQRMVEIKIGLKKDHEVYEDLSKRFEKGKLPDLLEISLLDLAIENKNYELTEAVLRKASFAKMPEDALIRYSDLASELKRPDIATFIKSKLSKEYLQETPLLAAVLDVAEESTYESIAALAKIPQNLISLPEQKLILVSIYIRHNYPDFAFSLVDKMSIADIFSAIDAAQFAEMYLSMKEAKTGMQRIMEAKKDAAPKLQASLDNALFFMQVGAGDINFVQKWLKDNKEPNLTMLYDAAYMATRFKQYPIALSLSERVYKLSPTPENRIELSEILIMNSQYNEALKLLQPLAEKNKYARSVYLNGAADWLRKDGINSGESRIKLNSFLAIMLKSHDLLQDEKRDLAYLMMETGFKDKAEDIFIELAGNQQFGSHDVSELLGFWGDTLSPKAVSWIKARVISSPESEKAKWLSHANDAGHPEIAIYVLSGRENELSNAVADEYINALIATRSYEKLATIINNEMDKENSVSRIQNLAKLANQESLPEVAEKGWRKLYAIDPNNKDANKELGLLAYSRNHFTEAQGFLENYIKNNEGDYIIHDAYGEILMRKSQPKKAMQYFEIARRQLAEIKDKTQDELLLEASILYRCNHVKESFDLYRKLLAKYPDNKSLRADFIQALIDNKQFNEASLLLSR